jgi:hypothetical protein
MRAQPESRPVGWFDEEAPGDDQPGSGSPSDLDTHERLVRLFEIVEGSANAKSEPSVAQASIAFIAVCFVLQRPFLYGKTQAQCAADMNVPKELFNLRVRRVSEQLGLPIPGGMSELERARIVAGIARSD